MKTDRVFQALHFSFFSDDDLPSPPPFMREALTNVNSDSERVPGSLGERLGKNRVSYLTNTSPFLHTEGSFVVSLYM